MAPSSSSSSKKVKRKIRLRSSDGKVFRVREKVAVYSQTIRFLIEDDCADTTIPLHNVDGCTLFKVIRYCKKHVKCSSTTTLRKWDAKYINVGQHVLFDLMMAANYLEIQGLLDLACQAVADITKGKTPEEIRKILKIKNEFTPEEEEEIHRENPWAFQ